MHTIYTSGEAIKNAYLVQRGPLFVTLPFGEPVAVNADTLIVGTLEPFLKGVTNRHKKRMFDLAIEDPGQVKVISLELVDSMMRQYEFGFNTNIFLARLLELTNHRYVERNKSLSEEERAYHLRASIFARFVDEVYLQAEKLKFRELAAFAADSRKEAMYLDGLALAREGELTTVDLSGTTLNEFICRFPKGAPICREGDDSHEMYALLRGKIAVTIDGRYITVLETAGEAFGELSLFLDGKRTATLVAESDVDLYVIRKDQLPGFHASHTDVFLNIAKTLAQRICQNIEAIERLGAPIKEGSETEEEKRRRLQQLKTRGKRELRTLFRKFLTEKEKLKSTELDELWKKYSKSYNTVLAEQEEDQGKT